LKNNARNLNVIANSKSIHQIKETTMPPTPGNADLRKFYDPKKVLLYWLKRAGIVLAILAAASVLAYVAGYI